LNPGRGKKISFLQNINTGFEAHSASYLKNTWIFSWDTATGASSNSQTPYRAEFRNEWSYNSIPLHIFSWREQGQIFLYTPEWRQLLSFFRLIERT